MDIMDLDILVKQHISEVWGKFNQNRPVWIRHILIWNFGFLIFSKYGYISQKKMIKVVFLVKQDILKIWANFNQNQPVFIRDILI
jgi:hypothetical protein